MKVLLVLLFPFLLGADWYGFDFTYTATGEVRTLSWTPDEPPVADFYNIEVLKFPPVDGQPSIFSEQTIETSAEWLPSRAGIYWARVNSCIDTDCSRWSESVIPTDTAISDGFVMIIFLSVPSGGGLE